jgi:uncharacterized cupredoxin-like copper-binding protein
MMGGVAPMGARMLLTAEPATVRSGQVSLVVDNTGWRTHELVVLPLAAGAGDGIVSGAVGWVTVTLSPGHYELVCNLQNHYANGMRQELVVTG